MRTNMILYEKKYFPFCGASWVALDPGRLAPSVCAKQEGVSQDSLYRCLLERLVKERYASGHDAGGGKR